LYAEATETAEDEEAKKKEEQRQALRNALTEASRRAYQLRREFVSEISNTKAKKNMAVIIEYLLRSMIDTYINISYEEIAEFLNIKLNEDAEDELSFDTIAEQVASQPERCLLIVTYLSLDSENENYFDWRNDYRENENLDMVYDFLEKLGYEMSDDEQALKNGTHELFRTMEGEQDD
jgi:ParB family chromosome partitioning protein